MNDSRVYSPGTTSPIRTPSSTTRARVPGSMTSDRFLATLPMIGSLSKNPFRSGTITLTAKSDSDTDQRSCSTVAFMSNSTLLTQKEWRPVSLYSDRSLSVHGSMHCGQAAESADGHDAVCCWSPPAEKTHATFLDRGIPPNARCITIYKKCDTKTQKNMRRLYSMELRSTRKPRRLPRMPGACQ